MKLFKKLIFLLIVFIFPFVAKAASGKITVSGTSTVVVGNRVTFTVTLSSSTLIGSWQMHLNYDKSFLQLTSTTSESNGTVMASSSTTGVKTKKYTYTFKTLKKGSTTVSVKSYLAYDYNNPTEAGELQLTSTGKTIKIITQQELEASYSKDNNLKSLAVDGLILSPEFNKDVLEYNVVAPENTKEINIVAVKNDATATVSGIGKFNVNQGINVFEITVRAQNGAEKKYKISVDVKDSNPINVIIDDNTYTVVKLKEYLPKIDLYEQTTIKINDFDIPAYYSNTTNKTLVGLKDSQGVIKYFVYDVENNSYLEYKELMGNKITIFPIKTDKIIKNYELKEIVINDININGFVYPKNPNQVIIYGVNVETGEEDFYIFDQSLKTFILYNDEEIKDLNEEINIYKYIIYGSSLLIILLIILIIVISNKKKSKKTKKKEEK